MKQAKIILKDEVNIKIDRLDSGLEVLDTGAPKNGTCFLTFVTKLNILTLCLKKIY